MKRVPQGSALLVAWFMAGLGLIMSGGVADAARYAPPDQPYAGSIASAPNRTSPSATGIAPAIRPVPAPSRTPPSPALTAVVQQYCVVCHNDALLTGNLSLQHFAVEHAPEKRETAEKMIRKLRAGMMPPPGIPRPAADTLLALVETLETTVDAVARSSPNLGTRRFQRLSRPEYERVIRELLGLEVNADNWLPADLLVGSFDNMSAAQALSTTLLDSYLKAATDVSRLAIGKPAGTVVHHQAPQSHGGVAARMDQIEGAPFGTRGGMVVTHDFPADGEYVFRVETDFGSGNQVAAEDVDISIDGEPVALLKLEYNAAGTVPAIETEPIFVRAGQRRVSAAFVNLVEGPYEDRFSPTAWSKAGTAGSNYGVTGPHPSEGTPHHRAEQRLGRGGDREPAPDLQLSAGGARGGTPLCAVDSHAARHARLPAAARRTTTSPTLMSFYDAAAAEEGFEAGVRMGLQAILVSPEFVFRLEREPADTRPGEGYPLSDIDLATRLSFFLWATVPDEELLEVAGSGRLSDPDVLEAQVERMLADPRSETLATRFAHQWLRLQDVGKVWPESYLYPDFSQQLADAMVRETELLFDHLVREDRSLLELLDADYTFLNQRLARHYGIEGDFPEDGFRRVPYPDDRRRGVLGHGSVLHLTSMSGRTSPVLRGKWVMEVLMGTPPPPPPPNVPTLEGSPAADGGRTLTHARAHGAAPKQPVCSSCHNFIDPIGLALDKLRRDRPLAGAENMAPLDTRGIFYDGTALGTPGELAAVLLKRPIPLARNFAEHLFSYAIGRPADHLDQPTLRVITRAAADSNYSISSIVMGIVRSAPFRMRQTQEVQ